MTQTVAKPPEIASPTAAQVPVQRTSSPRVYHHGRDRARPIGLDGGGTAGEIRDNGRCFRKAVRGSVHRCRALDAWGYDLTLVQRLQAMAVERVQVDDLETRISYRTGMGELIEKGVVRNLGGRGDQVFLPLRYWAQEAMGAGR